MIALVGPTGSGKSTLVNLLPAFYEVSGGRILIDGQDAARLSLPSLREHISVVSQEAFLFNGTVRENILYGKLDATEEQLLAAARAANCHEFISRLPDGYDSRVGERGVKLSVGEKQRVSIARALLKNAPILILDEATASVDTATERLIQEALERLLANRTSFVIAHRLSTIRRADQILVLRQGEIVERGTHAELLEEDGLYAKLSRIQNTTFIEESFEKIPLESS
jgi:ATP-binding cassette subfamily B protein/subfamily B ATP-binding cassette protein MsbA